MPSADVGPITTDTPNHALITDRFLLETLRTVSSARDAALHVLSLTSPSDPTSTTTNPPNADSDSLAPSTATALALSRAQKPLYAHLSLLRSQNRRLAHLCRSSKAQTSTYRSEVDTLHLSLQNLHYESRHLAGEIGACERFPHTYSLLPLVSEEEFLATREDWAVRIARVRRGGGDAREGEGEMGGVGGGGEDAEMGGEGDLAAPNNTQHENDEPKASSDDGDWSEEGLMRARIQAEMAERVRLEEVRKGLVARKVELVRENAKRKEELGKLDSELETFINAAKPIQITFEKEW